MALLETLALDVTDVSMPEVLPDREANSGVPSAVDEPEAPLLSGCTGEVMTRKSGEGTVRMSAGGAEADVADSLRVYDDARPL